MKQFAFIFLASMTAAAFAADTPEQIAEDYRGKAAVALKKVNETLEKATVPLVADLVKKGDTTGADALKDQLRAKTAGDAVLVPHPAAASLFKSYDAARSKALEPAQKAAIARIGSLLASSEGKKIEIVAKLSKVRAEIEAGKTTQRLAFPTTWTYHRFAKGPTIGELTLNPDGTFKIVDSNSKQEVDTGKWVQVSEGALDLDRQGTLWKMTFAKNEGVIERPDLGKRYITAVSEKKPTP